MVTLASFREKWREAPQGSDTDGRVFSSDLLALADDALLARWDAMAARRASGEAGWLETLYADTFRDRRVLELGSGLGFDALRFAGRGAHWTCADIVPDNLALIRRVAALKRLDDRIATHLIPDDLAFVGLQPGYDAVWVFGRNGISESPRPKSSCNASVPRQILRRRPGWELTRKLEQRNGAVSPSPPGRCRLLRKPAAIGNAQIKENKRCPARRRVKLLNFLEVLACGYQLGG